MPLLLGTAASAVVPPPQFNCVQSVAKPFATGIAVAIPDATGPATSPITVSGLVGKVNDIDVTTNIAHQNAGDLLITLTGPSGKRIELSAFNGDGTSGVFAGTTWDDDANPGGGSTLARNEGLVADHTYTSGTVATPLVPQEALAAFVGDDPNGVWTLTVEDVVPSNTGTIDGWSISIATDQSTSNFGPFAITPAGLTSIPDGGTVSIPLNVLSQNRRIVGLEVRLDGFNYTGLSDLALTLTSPAGTIVTLTRGNGLPTTDASLANVSWGIPRGPYTGFSTRDPITRIDFGASPLPPFIAPEESFGVFRGQDPSGTWNLSATDAGVVVGGGFLSGWSLTVFVSECAGNAALTGVTAPAAGTRIGAPGTYSATAVSTGAGSLSSASLGFNLDRGFQVTSTTPDAGGTCVNNRTSSANTVTCTWPGPIPPGASRTARVNGEGSWVGPGVIVSDVTMRTSTGVNILGATTVDASAKFPVVNFLPSDVRAFNGRRCTVVGTPGPDNFTTFLTGGAHPVLCGRGGNDLIEAANNATVIDGGPGNDFLRGGTKTDAIGGGSGDDQIYGGAGADELRGGPGKDRIFGQAGRDRLFGDAGADVLSGGPGSDFAVAGPRDRVLGIERP